MLLWHGDVTNGEVGPADSFTQIATAPWRNHPDDDIDELFQSGTVAYVYITCVGFEGSTEGKVGNVAYAHHDNGRA